MEDSGRKRGFKNEKMFIIPSDFLLRCQEHPIIRSLYITDAGFFPRAVDHYRERTMGICENILIYCIDGRGTIELSSHRIDMHKGSLYSIPAEESHRYYARQEEPWSIFWAHFRGSSVQYYPIRERRKMIIKSPEENERLQGWFQHLLQILEYDYTTGNFICITNLLSTILSEIYLRETPERTSKTMGQLTKAIQYMYGQINRPVTLDELTDFMGLSKSRMTELFREHTRFSPMDFFSRLKIQEACKQLWRTDKRVYEIADALGYKDQFYFSRIFKKVIGVSPSEYKNGIHEKNENL